MDIYTIVIAIGGYVIAFVVACAWGYSEKYGGDFSNYTKFSKYILGWLEKVAENPKIRTRIDSFWDSDIKPAIDKFARKVFGNGTMDWASVMIPIDSWGEEPWDDEKNEPAKKGKKDTEE